MMLPSRTTAIQNGLERSIKGGIIMARHSNAAENLDDSHA
jgi:hypothetical protein